MYKVGRSRTPQGVRGLKQKLDDMFASAVSRTPQGVRGLKPITGNRCDCKTGSHSARSAWIETKAILQSTSLDEVALRKECVD